MIITGMDITNSTERFSDRVADYVKYRPSYPPEVVDMIITESQFDQQISVADIGSGTGIFSKLLLNHHMNVIGVEPNEGMRRAAEQQLSQYENFSSVNGQSENTTLADTSIDLITAAQAFHWFKGEETKREFSRILKPGGYLALIWNQRDLTQSFQQEYDRVLRKFAPDYNSVNHMNISPTDIEDFVYPAKMSLFNFEYQQIFDLPGLLGRMQSSSYTPEENTREHAALIDAVEKLFNRFESNGSISFEYSTRLYLAQFPS